MRRLAAALTAAFVCTASHDAADWSGQLQPGLPVEAWFDADRTRGFLRVDGTTSRIYRAWKVDVADLDGDGIAEIILGVWSNTRRHDEPDPHRAVRVLRWSPTARQLEDVWRGSALARPLKDFEMRGAKLVAQEWSGEHCYRTTYRWSGFGFAAETTVRKRCEER